ncbi:MAG: prepilin-type N-terminal cleavage/methylation domain-containing protein [Myxococcota bacterium]
MRRSEAAFTLLEVMAAVAVVAIVFTTLSRVSSEGLRSEGTSKRRFEASLLADEILAGIEEQAALGIMPEIGDEEHEEGIYTVLIEGSAMNLENVFPIGEEEPRDDPSDGPTAPPMWVHALRITVEWEEGALLRHVIRHTFAVDYALVATGETEAADGTPPSAGRTVGSNRATESRDTRRIR